MTARNAKLAPTGYLTGMGLGTTAQGLIEAALEAFAERGYHASTTREIGARVGLSPAAVYVYFPSKADLLFQISLYGHRTEMEEIKRSMAGLSDPRERLRAFASTMAEWHASHNTLARVIQYEFRSLPADQVEEVIQLRREFTTMLHAEISQGVEAGLFDPPEAEGTGTAILSLCIDVARWYVPGGDRDPADIGRLYGELALRMVGATA